MFFNMYSGIQIYWLTSEHIKNIIQLTNSHELGFMKIDEWYDQRERK